jgi:hypothetical protein
MATFIPIQGSNGQLVYVNPERVITFVPGTKKPSFISTRTNQLT